MTRTGQEPKLYRELASWFHLLTAPEEYAEEAALYTRLLLEASERPVRTVLELGSGGGNNASHMKAEFELILVDRSAQMLELSRSLNPECRHVEGDMRSIRLGGTFDAVFVHDAVSYITTEHDLRAVIETAFVHCEEGGVALFVPDFVHEQLHPKTSHGGHDGPDRSLRYLEWTWDPDPSDTEYLVDFAYLLRDETGGVRVEQDRHVCGAFPEATWLRLFREVGFEPEARLVSHEDEPGGRLFLGVRRG